MLCVGHPVRHQDRNLILHEDSRLKPFLKFQRIGNLIQGVGVRVQSVAVLSNHLSELCEGFCVLDAPLIDIILPHRYVAHPAPMVGVRVWDRDNFLNH